MSSYFICYCLICTKITKTELKIIKNYTDIKKTKENVIKKLNKNRKYKNKNQVKLLIKTIIV